MSIRKNILANYLGQFYVALIGILLVPLYLQYMGAEAYGLVGFYAMLQSWFFMLDMGLTPTMARETARFQGGGCDALTLRRLLRAMEGVFVVIALLGAVGIIYSADFIAGQWLKVEHLPAYEVSNSLILIALIIALRWMSGLYRSAITGFEQLVWLNVFNMIAATARFVLVVPVLVYVDSSPTTFFGYQLAITAIESLFFFLKAYKLIPAGGGEHVAWSWQPLRASMKFSLIVAFAGMVWVVITQTDKLMLSGLISLEDYGFYTLAVLLASGLMIITRPISGALLPRMTKLHAEGNEQGMLRLYRNATQAVAIIAIPSSLVLSVFASHVLFVWTGNGEIAQKATPVLFLYAIGNGIMVFTAFPYYIQYAKGALKLHLIGNAILVILFIPMIYYLVRQYGVIGAGYAWITINALFFFFYVPIVHIKFAQGLHGKWLLGDIVSIGVWPVIVITIADQLVAWPNNRLMQAEYLALTLVCSVMSAALGSAKAREAVRKWAR